MVRNSSLVSQCGCGIKAAASYLTLKGGGVFGEKRDCFRKSDIKTHPIERSGARSFL
jgi:hypothetical protein